VRDGTAITRAPLKGQCARKNFYGSKELEGLFSQLEQRQCNSIRAALQVANFASAPDFTPEELYHFLEAVIFQRARTALEIEKKAPATGAFMLEAFKHYLKSRKDLKRVDEMISHIEAGNVTVTEPASATIIRSIGTALDNTLAIADLRICLLRNRTDYPFIFSDAPVVFYNMYCRKVRNRGVLGLQCPGLQIFFPLNPWTLALLIDGDKYEGPFKEYLQFDVLERSDVSQINALQLHHSLNTIYFGQPDHESYARDLWAAHRRSLTPISNNFVVGAKFWIDGKPPEGTLLQMFEPQIEHELSLTFVNCRPISEADYVFSPRNSEIHEELRQRLSNP
jgi:hypothetical protein